MDIQYDDALLAAVAAAPTGPGCYLYSDRYGNTIYVGKAKNLRSRVKSYFTPAAREDERLEGLLPRITAVEYRPTGSELDALLLEYSLIKAHKPWFNAQMKADKPRPFLRIAAGAPYPTLRLSAAREEDGAAYFDGFTDEEDVKEALALLAGVWGTARCGREGFGRAASPCLYHSLGGCTAPCAHLASPAAYAAAVEEICALLAGRGVPRLAALQSEMQRHAAALAFEKAAACKGQLAGLRRLRAKARRLYHYPQNTAVVVLARPHRAGPEGGFSAFYVAGGAVRARRDFAALPTAEEAGALLQSFRAAGQPLQQGEEMARALTEISARKAFVPLAPRAGGTALHKEMKRFCLK